MIIFIIVANLRIFSASSVLCFGFGLLDAYILLKKTTGTHFYRYIDRTIKVAHAAGISSRFLELRLARVRELSRCALLLRGNNHSWQLTAYVIN